MSVRDGFQPLRIPVDPHRVSSPGALPVLIDVSKKLEESISYWPGPSYPADWPPTKFPTDAPSLVEVFRASDPNVADDLKALAWDAAKGGPRYLDASQLEQLATSGTFDVKSKYPPHNHKWKVANWLQKGRSPTHRSFERGLGKGLYHVLVGIPHRLFRNSVFSVRQGLSSVRTGARKLVSLVVGWHETCPKYYASEVDAILRERENDHVKEQLEGSESSFDARVFDNKLWEEHGARLEACRRKATSRVEARMPEEWIRVRTEAGMHPGGSEGVSVARLLRRRAWTEAAAIVRADLTLPAGYGDLWLDREHLEMIVSEVEEDMLQDMDHKRNEVRQQLVDKHPILSTIPEWLEEQVEQRIDRECSNDTYRRGWYGKVPDRALKEDIGPLGVIYREHILPFRLEQAPVLRRQLEQEVKPGRVFEVPSRIWRPKNWVKCEETLRSSKRYFPEKHRIRRVSTDAKFWRVSLIVHESLAHLNNGLYWAWQSLSNGTFGFKSMFYRHPFVSQYKMDHLTGYIVPDQASLTRTYCSRLVAVTDEVMRIRRDFEARPDTGLLGKPFARVLNVLSAYVGIGIPGVTIVLLGQPLLTALQVLVASAIAVMSPVWGPLSGLAVHGLCMTIYDFHHPRDDNRWFPLLRIALWNLGLAGIGQTSIALGMGLVVHPALAALRFIFETIRRQLRMGYDRLIWLLLLRRCRIPSQDSFIAWRIAGPGITADYCFQIRSDVAVLVLVAKLEELELDLFYNDTTSKISEPIVAYNMFFKNFELFGLHVAAGTSSVNLQKFRTLVKEQQEDLSRQVAKRRKTYRELTAFVPRDEADGPVRREANLGRVRQFEQDLDATLRKGTGVAAEFYERLKNLYSEEALSSFWFNAKVLPGDFGGLVKALLARSFGETFWTPMEATDATIVIPIEHKTLESLICDVMSS